VGSLRLKNTYSKQVEPFTALDPSGKVTLYSCGPTVYSFAHIGCCAACSSNAVSAYATWLNNYVDDEAEQPDLHPRAAEHVPELLAMIQTLLERGHAYVDASGQVYFAVTTFADYGKLSGKVLDELESGARIAVRAE
jgi:cysteinyl-tRNA synthetase